MAAIKAALPEDGVVFSDMTQIAYFGNYAYPVENPGQWFHPSGYGTLGFALPAALGAKISSPARTVIALAGDFGLQFTQAELMTAVEAGLSLPIVVWNNAALGQIRDDMVAADIPQLGVIARNPDFVALAHACGAEGLPGAQPAALTEALRHGHQPWGTDLDRSRCRGLREIALGNLLSSRGMPARKRQLFHTYKGTPWKSQRAASRRSRQRC